MASELVELLRRYSNRAGLLERLLDVLRRIKDGEQDGQEPLDLPGPKPTGRQLGAIRDRLTEREVRDLVASFHAGTSQRELAERYGISVRSVRRLLSGSPRPSDDGD